MYHHIRAQVFLKCHAPFLMEQNLINSGLARANACEQPISALQHAMPHFSKMAPTSEIFVKMTSHAMCRIPCRRLVVPPCVGAVARTGCVCLWAWEGVWNMDTSLSSARHPSIDWGSRAGSQDRGLCRLRQACPHRAKRR